MDYTTDDKYGISFKTRLDNLPRITKLKEITARINFKSNLLTSYDCTLKYRESEISNILERDVVVIARQTS